MDAPFADRGVAMLRLGLLACAIVLGTAVVRTGTDVLHGLAYGTPVAAPARPGR